VSEEKQQKVEINVVQVVASALAAVSSAVLLSKVGVAGTVLGAAIGSVIVTVGAAVYSYSLQISRERVQAAQAAALARMSRVRTGAETRSLDLEEQPSADTRPPWREALGRLPWKWIAAVTGAVFAIAMITILCFELIAGESVSSITGGSTGNGHRTSLGLGSAKSAATQSPTPSPTTSGSLSPGSSSSSSPGATVSTSTTPTPGSGRSAAVAPTRAPTRTTPTPTPTPSVSSKPSLTPTATPSSGASPAPSASASR
jgi:hypothetical protein